MYKKTVKTTTETEITPEEAAKTFARAGATEQARFFNELAKEVIAWPTGRRWQKAFKTQMEFIKENQQKALTPEAKELIKLIK